MINHELSPENEDCPICGAQPTTLSAFSGNMFYAECSKCGWFGGSVSFEITYPAALFMWNRKVLKYKEDKEYEQTTFI